MSELPDDPGYPWERREDESDKAWVAFQHYRDTPAGERTAAKTAQHMMEQGGHKGTFKTMWTRCQEWSRRYDWVDRARAWTGELDRRRRQTMIEADGKMNERNATQLMAAVRLVSEPVNQLVRDLQNKQGEVGEWLSHLEPAKKFDLALRCAKVLPELMDAEARTRGAVPIPQTIVDADASGARREAHTSMGERTAAVWAALEQGGFTPEAPLPEEQHG